jgi:hypothetical protein
MWTYFKWRFYFEYVLNKQSICKYNVNSLCQGLGLCQGPVRDYSYESCLESVGFTFVWNLHSHFTYTYHLHLLLSHAQQCAQFYFPFVCVLNGCSHTQCMCMQHCGWCVWWPSRLARFAYTTHPYIGSMLGACIFILLFVLEGWVGCLGAGIL